MYCIPVVVRLLVVLFAVQEEEEEMALILHQTVPYGYFIQVQVMQLKNNLELSNPRRPPLISFSEMVDF